MFSWKLQWTERIVDDSHNFNDNSALVVYSHAWQHSNKDNCSQALKTAELEQ
jgi:hypothetical protein